MESEDEMTHRDRSNAFMWALLITLIGSLLITGMTIGGFVLANKYW